MITTRIFGWTFAAMLAAAVPAAGQTAADSALRLDGLLATRAELEQLAARLEGRRDDTTARAIRRRLVVGDLAAGDRLLLEVVGEPTLTDTFAVDVHGDVALPPPVGSAVSVRGLLRAELQPRLAAFVARFIRHPVVRVTPLIRLSVQGEVVRAGFYAVPARAALADALMAAGGTTRDADLRRLRVEREGRPLWDGADLQRALAVGRTIDELGLRDGDQIAVRRGSVAGTEEKLRFLWVAVSLVGGVYGLTRIF